MIAVQVLQLAIVLFVLGVLVVAGCALVAAGRSDDILDEMRDDR